jgi:circadian clock protein KaiB
LRNVAEWELQLFIAGDTPRSRVAIENIGSICETHLKGSYHLDVIDLAENPQLAIDEQIIAIPTLVRKLPMPIKKVLGDLSSIEKVVNGLGIKQKNTIH